MTTLRLMAFEAWHEFRAGCRGPLVLIAFPALIAYLILVLLNADYMRDMGATDVPRNSPHLVYLMTAGQAVWLLFAWAWVFAQPVVRDQTARLHEVMLSAPVSLPALFAGRYLGALGLGCLLVLATGAGFLLVPPLGAAGLFAPDVVGPQPLFAIGHSFLLLTVPSAAGLGALFLCAAIRTRGVAGPFALAAALMLIWMVAMVVVRGGDASPVLATILDPSGFAEVEEQTNLWTPREKAAGVLRTTPALVANRLIWTLPGLLLLGIVLRRTGREGLVLEKAPGGRAGRESRFADEAAPADVGAPLPGPPGRPSWVRVAASEAAWHFTLSFRGWGTPLALGMLAAMGVGGSFYHIVMHADGPLLPRSGLIEPLAVEFFYLVVVFMVAAFVGVMARRDDRAGYAEIVDAAPAPLGARVAGRALAAGALTLVFALTPAFAVWIVLAVAVPDAFSLLDPLRYFGLLLGPALLELCALVLAVHALIRHAGAAYATRRHLRLLRGGQQRAGGGHLAAGRGRRPGPRHPLRVRRVGAVALARAGGRRLQAGPGRRDRRPGVARLAARDRAHRLPPLAGGSGPGGRRRRLAGGGRRRSGGGGLRRASRTVRDAGRLSVRGGGDGRGRGVGGPLVGLRGALHGGGRRGACRDRPGRADGGRPLAPARRPLRVGRTARLSAARLAAAAGHRRWPGRSSDGGVRPLRAAPRRVRDCGPGRRGRGARLRLGRLLGGAGGGGAGRGMVGRGREPLAAPFRRMASRGRPAADAGP